MLIQNANSAPPTALPPRLASDGAPSAIVAKKTAAPPQANTVDSASTQAQPLSASQLKEVVDSANQAMQKAGQALEFSVDPDSNKPVIKMVDKETGELIRQIPSDEMLAISHSIDQFLQRQGLLLSQKA